MAVTPYVSFSSFVATQRSKHCDSVFVTRLGTFFQVVNIKLPGMRLYSMPCEFNLLKTSSLICYHMQVTFFLPLFDDGLFPAVRSSRLIISPLSANMFPP